MHRLRHSTVALLPAAILLLAAQPVRGQTFTRVTDPANPIVADPGPTGFTGMSWIDFDSDGLDDLFVVGRALYRNLGGGTFARILIPNNAGNGIGHSWADVDNDGDADLLIADSGGTRGTRYWRNDGGTFTQVTTGVVGDSLANSGWSCAWGDYDADGFVDAVIAQANGFTGMNQPNTLLHSLGDGTFERDLTTDVTVGLAPYTIPTWSDFDLDGDLDLSIGAGPANGTLGPDYFYRNRRIEGGAPLLERITTGVLATVQRDGQIINWIDYDNDGDLDCFIANYRNRLNQLYRNDGGVYVQMTHLTAGAILTEIGFNISSVWADFDNDGDLDCFVGRVSSSPCRYYRNEGTGTFTSLALGNLTSGPGNAAAADYDQDGDVDLYFGLNASLKGLYRNDLANGNHWFQARLIGTTSNRSAIGARIHARATIGGQVVWQIREVSAQNTFAGHSSFTQHFGLGDALRVDELRIVWPLGMVETYYDLPADSIMTFVEGQVPTAVDAALSGSAVFDWGIELTWYGRDLGFEEGLAVERRSEALAWTSIGAPRVEDADRVSFADRGVAAGRWAYRLRFADGSFTPESWVDVGEVRLAVRALGTRLSRNRLALEVEVPHAGEATLQVIDVGGRSLARLDLGRLDPGRRRVDLEVPDLGSGIYWVRLVHEGRSATARALVLR